MTLQKHLGDRRGAAEIAVDLKRRMQIKQIAGGGFLQKLLQMRMRRISVLQARIEIGDPGAAPTCMAAAVVQPPFKSDSRRLRQLRSGSRGNLPTGMQCKQMGHMTVTRLCLLIILHPFLQLPMPADLERRQPIERLLQFSAKL